MCFNLKKITSDVHVLSLALLYTLVMLCLGCGQVQRAIEEVHANENTHYTSSPYASALGDAASFINELLGLKNQETTQVKKTGSIGTFSLKTWLSTQDGLPLSNIPTIYNEFNLLNPLTAPITESNGWYVQQLNENGNVLSKKFRYTNGTTAPANHNQGNFTREIYSTDDIKAAIRDGTRDLFKTSHFMITRTITTSNYELTNNGATRQFAVISFEREDILDGSGTITLIDPDYPSSNAKTFKYYNFSGYCTETSELPNHGNLGAIAISPANRVNIYNSPIPVFAPYAYSSNGEVRIAYYTNFTEYTLEFSIPEASETAASDWDISDDYAMITIPYNQNIYIGAGTNEYTEWGGVLHDKNGNKSGDYFEEGATPFFAAGTYMFRSRVKHTQEGDGEEAFADGFIDVHFKKYTNSFIVETTLGNPSAHQEETAWPYDSSGEISSYNDGRTIFSVNITSGKVYYSEHNIDGSASLAPFCISNDGNITDASIRKIGDYIYVCWVEDGNNIYMQKFDYRINRNGSAEKLSHGYANYHFNFEFTSALTNETLKGHMNFVNSYDVISSIYFDGSNLTQEGVEEVLKDIVTETMLPTDANASSLYDVTGNIQGQLLIDRSSGRIYAVGLDNLTAPMEDIR